MHCKDKAVLQGAFVKIRDFIKFKGFLVEFLEHRRSCENQKPPENRQKSGLFWASFFRMHLVCTLLITFSREKMHTPSLPPPLVFGQKAFFRGRVGGSACIFWSPRGRSFIPPPLPIHPPALEVYFHLACCVPRVFRSYFNFVVFFLIFAKSCVPVSLKPSP